MTTELPGNGKTRKTRQYLFIVILLFDRVLARNLTTYIPCQAAEHEPRRDTQAGLSGRTQPTWRKGFAEISARPLQDPLFLSFLSVHLTVLGPAIDSTTRRSFAGFVSAVFNRVSR